WALFTLILFTPARNLLWTYELPAIPPLAILIGRAMLRRSRPNSSQSRLLIAGLAALAPIASLILTVLAVSAPDRVKSERPIIQYAAKHWPDAQIWYVDQRPFSARFYSQGRARLVSTKDLLSA